MLCEEDLLFATSLSVLMMNVKKTCEEEEGRGLQKNFCDSWFESISLSHFNVYQADAKEMNLLLQKKLLLGVRTVISTTVIIN